LTGRVRDELLLRTNGKTEERADELLSGCGLDRAGAGQTHSRVRRRAAPAVGGTALVAAPALLILDEPTFGQDRQHLDGAGRNA